MRYGHSVRSRHRTSGRLHSSKTFCYFRGPSVETVWPLGTVGLAVPVVVKTFCYFWTRFFYLLICRPERLVHSIIQGQFILTLMQQIIFKE